MIRRLATRRRAAVLLALLALLALTIGWQAIRVARSPLLGPADAVEDALLVRLLTESVSSPAGEASGWLPYQRTTLRTAPGFHLVAAAVARVTAADPVTAATAVGAASYAVLVFAVVALARALSASWPHALACGVFCNFAASQPVEYSGPGGYPLTLGLALAAVALAGACSGRRWLTALALAATALTHEYALAILLLYLLVLAVSHPLRAVWIVRTGSAGLLCALPWLLHLLLVTRTSLGDWAPRANVPYDPTYLWRLLAPPTGGLVVALALIALAPLHRGTARGASGFRKEAGAPVVAGWLLVSLVMLGPWSLGSFGADYAARSLILPAALMAPGPLLRLGKQLAVLGVVTVCLLAFALTARSTEVNVPKVDRDDLAALSWLSKSSSADAVILIDTQQVGGAYVGVDGGWWVQAMSGRRSMPAATANRGAGPQLAAMRGYAHRLEVLASLPDHLYCRELSLIAQQAAATHYYTRSQRPARCAGVAAVYANAQVTVWGLNVP